MPPMPQWQKVALGLFGATCLAQSAAGLFLLGYVERMETQYDAVHKAGLYLLNIMERENVQLTDFDLLALEALKPNPVGE